MSDPTIYLPFDNNQNIFPSNIAPTTIGASSSIDGAVYRFGGASRKDTGAGNATIWAAGLQVPFSNEGTLYCWFYATSGISTIVNTITFYDAAVGGNILLQLKVFWNGSSRALNANFFKAGVDVSGASSPVFFDDILHLVAVSWSANTPTGNAEVSYDGSVKTTSTGLNAIDISDTIRRVELVTDTDPNANIWLDEVAYFPVRQYTGDFTARSSPAWTPPEIQSSTVTPGDMKLSQGDDGAFDISILDGDIEGEEGFDGAIYQSLASDARAPADKVLRPEDRRGWMGDIASPIEGRKMGSLLWLSEQRRLTQNTLNQTVDYARKALNWFVEDGIASNLEVSGVIVPTRGIRLKITITSSLTGQTENHYINMWELTGQ